MRISIHIWKFEILLWFRRKPPLVVVADPCNYEDISRVAKLIL